MESPWIQLNWMENQRIQCYIEWSPTEVNVIEWNISKFNVIMNGNPLSAMELNGTSVNSMLYWMNPTEVNVIEAIMNKIPLKSMWSNGPSMSSML